MKNYIKGFGIIVALLYSMNALAGGNVKVNGVTVGTAATGLDNDGNAASASIDVGSGKCTLTMIPGSGKYITVNEISAIKTIDGSNAQTRTPGINTPVTITATDDTADPSGTTSYTFDVPTTNEYDYEVTATFQSRTSVDGATVEVVGGPYTYSGSAIKPDLKVTVGGVTLTKDTDYKAYYKDSINAGTNTGKVIIEGIRKYNGSRGDWNNPATTYTINPKSIAGATITLTPESSVYNGQNQKPTVSVKDGEKDLVLDTDYTLTNDGGTNVGEYNVTITGKGNYDANTTATKKFTITPKSIANATMTLDHESFVYNGQNQKPSVTLVKDGETELTLDTDYTVTNEGGTNAGEYTVTVAGKGNYDAQTTVTKTFTITKATPTLTYSSDKAEARVGEAFTAPTLDNPSKVAVTYSSSKTDVATISEEGVITLVGAGQTTITASFAGDGNYERASASYELTVEKRKDAGLSWSDKDLEGMEYFLGDWWFGPKLINPNNLPVKYESSDEDVATIDKNGVVTALAVGDTWIKAIFEGNDEYEPQTIRYALMVKERYDLLVNDTRVTSDNSRDVLGDGHFFYDENTKQLVVTSNETPVTIESRLKNLTIFLNGSSKLERIFFNNEGNEQNTGSLTITTYENIPGKVVLETSHADGVISGFSSLTIDDKSYTYLLDPAEGKYEGGKLVTSLGAVATTATIGQYLKPLVDGQTVTFPPGKFAIDNFTNMVIDDILYTMVLRADGSDEDDDFYDPVESAIVLNNLNSTSGVTMLIDNVEKSMLIPGSAEYALQFKGGITFMVPSGEGTITLNVKTEPGYKLMLMIGKSEPKEISQNEGGDVQFTYNVEKATYVCVYLVQSAGTRGTRIGKRDRHHGTIYSIKVEPTKVRNMNPLGEVEGYPGNQKPEVVVHSSTGIKEIKVKTTYETSGDDSWYDMQGRKIDKPTKAGIYIQNRKKIVIK